MNSVKFSSAKDAHFINSILDTVKSLFQGETAWSMIEHINTVTTEAIESTDDEGDPNLNREQANEAVKMSANLVNFLVRIDHQLRAATQAGVFETETVTAQAASDSEQKTETGESI